MSEPPRRTLMSPFVERPEEAAIIGRILAGYGEIEFFVYECLIAVLGYPNIAARVMFRLRSESHRLEAADAILRATCESHDLREEYLIVFAAANYCRKLRNQYAHCHWLPETDEGLFFCNLEESARNRSGDLILTFSHVDTKLLELQEAYCLYCMDMLLWLRGELQHSAARLPNRRFVKPKGITQPLRHNPPELHPLPQKSRTPKRPPEPPLSETL
jgi:hypothetical protein